MSDLAPFPQFPVGQKIKSDDADARLDELVAAHNAQDGPAGVLATRRTIATASATVGSATPTVTYFASGTATGGNEAPLAQYLSAADLAVPGKTAKLRIRAEVFTNGTAPGITFQFRLYEITASAGGADSSSFTRVAVTGSGPDIASPAANSRNQAASSEIALPPDGFYVLGLALSGVLGANCGALVVSHLQVRWV